MIGKDAVKILEKMKKNLAYHNKKEFTAMQLAIAELSKDPERELMIVQCECDCYRLGSSDCKYIRNRTNRKDCYSEGDVVTCPDYCEEDK